MLISCEKCSTTYVLDDALIPPQGAPVQCTRCGHVFTARVTNASDPAPVPRANAAANTTMMFGSSAPPPPSKNQTMMFGAGGTPPPPPAPPPPAKNQTMMFGTAASNAATQVPPPPAPSAKQTMVFGTGAAAPPPAAAAKNQTMMFGTPASNAAAQQQQPAPPPPSAKQTMVFGTGAAVPPPAAPAKNQTMMFGTPASNAAASAQPPPPANPPGSSAKTTIMFGGNASAPPPAAPPPSAKQTMVFGAVPGQPRPPPARPTFGTPASNASLNDAPADETILEAPGQSNRTMLFGAPSADAPNAPSAPPAKNQTMMFGRAPAIPKVTAGSAELAGMSADEGAPNESTVRVDHPTEDQPDAPGDEPAQPQRQDRTQRFAMTDLGGGSLVTPPEGRDPVQDRHNRTQLFAMSTAQETTAPSGDSLDSTLPGSVRALDDAASRARTMDLSSTLPPDQPLPALEAEPEPAGVSLLHDPANQAPIDQEPDHQEGLIATTLPNLGPVQGTRLPPLKLELPAEPGGSPQDFARPTAPAVSSQTAANEDAAAMRAARGGGAGRVVVIILALVALALAGVLIYRLFGDQIMNAINPPPPVGALVPSFR